MLKFTYCDAVRQFSGRGLARVLQGITRGFERECLRVDAAGLLARTPHPASLGAKLTHPWITTDYAEALLELITPPSQDPDFPLQFLRDLHRFTAAALHDELMWAGSMPCALGEDGDIAIADYGQSNAAQFKQVYRLGLGLRYGRQMQTIAGAHYNWSLPEEFWLALKDCCGESSPLQDFINKRYFGLVRNFLRFSWLIPYLFGASPALSKTFLRGRTADLQLMGSDTLYGPLATSLRMSDLGYQNRAQANLQVCFNSLAEYTQALEAAIRTPDPFYEALGTRKDGQWQQLNANLLQIENEFYAGIRPKRIGPLGERPALALHRYGVQYLEVRLFDLNPMVDIGIQREQADFADVLLMMCLFRDSPPISCREQAENDENKRRVVNQGRDPALQLLVHNREQPLRPLAHQLFDDMQPLADMLDTAYGGHRYASVLQRLRERIDHPALTPSAQVLEGIHAAGGFTSYCLDLAKRHRDTLLAEPLPEDTQTRFVASVQESLTAQQALEASDQGSFEDYVTHYFA